MNNNEIDPIWLGSLFGIISFTISALVFIGLNSDFFYATVKIIAISLCFYFFGMVLAIIFNFVAHSKEDNNHEKI